MKVLTFSCAHIGPNQDLSRFNILSKLIVDQKPEYVISLGDFVTMDSLSSWDSSSPRQQEGKRYAHDIQAGKTALYHLGSYIVKYNKTAEDNKKRKYLPQFVFIHGNHEDRVSRYLDKNPVTEYHVNLDLDLRFKAFPTPVILVPYKEDFELGGIIFKHCFIGDNGKSISRANVENYAIDGSGTSVVYGHHHFLRYKARKRANAVTVQSLCVGTFAEHMDPYLDGANPDRWNGAIMLDIHAPGEYDFTTWSITKMRREYGT